MSLEISVRPAAGDVAVLALTGRLDGVGAEAVLAALAGEVARTAEHIVLDCAELRYLSSAGIRALLRARKDLATRGGRLSLVALVPFCQSVLEMAGLSGTIPTFDSVAGALVTSARVPIASVSEHGSFEYVYLGDNYGTLDVMGDVADILESNITDASIADKPFFETEYSIGAGAMGAEAADYLPVIGEAIMVAGTLVWLPTDGNDMPDYMIPRKASTRVVLRSAFNSSIRGGFNDFVRFKAPKGQPATVRSLYRVLFDQARQRQPDFKGVIGIAMRAEMAEVYGAGVTRSPVLENKPANGLPITAAENFDDWFESDAEPRHTNTTALIVGAGADLTGDLSGINETNLHRMFYINPANVGVQTETLHNHAVFFTDAPPVVDSHDMDVIMRDVVERAEFADMRHLLDQSTIHSAVIAVSYIQEVREDERRQSRH